MFLEAVEGIFPYEVEEMISKQWLLGLGDS